MKLIVDDFDTDTRGAKVITESIDHFGKERKQLTLNGIFIVADKINRNGRKYIYEELKPEVDRFIKEDIAMNQAFGDFEHPDDGKVDRARAAVVIKKLTENPDHTWTGKAVVMCSDPEHGITGTPKGDLLKSYLDYGSPCGFSTRGVGEIIGDTVKDYHLSTIDAVLNPSVNLFCQGVLESKEFMVDTHGQIVECAISEFERRLNQSTKTFDFAKKRLLVNAALDNLFKKI